MKIAIVGSKPDTWHKVPELGSEWEIWRFSRTNWNKPPKYHRWFELHDKKHYARYQLAVPGYVEFLHQDRRVILSHHFPWRVILEEFGPYFFAGGQAPWIMAYAITLEPDTIGLWGIDPEGSYKPQRAEMQHFAQVARERGIEVIAPEDKILQPNKLYGLETDTISEIMTLMGISDERAADLFANPKQLFSSVAT